MKKNATKIAVSAAVVASAFVATAPNQADAATNVDQLVQDAQNAGTVLKWAISVEGSGDGVTQPWADYNNAKAAIAKAEAAIKGLSFSDKLKYEARLVDVKLQVSRAAAYIDAITSSKKINDLTASLNAAVATNNIDTVEAAYHTATAEFRKQTVLLDRVYGKSTRDAIRTAVKGPIEKLVAELKNDVTVNMLADAAAVDVAAGRYEAASAKLADAQAILDANVLKWETTLQKNVNDVVASITPMVTSVSAINSTEVTVKFNKTVDATLATSAANYSIDGVVLGTGAYTTATLELNADKKSVTITLPLAADLTSGSTYRIAVSDAVKDAAGNKIAAFETLYKFVDNSAPTVTSTKYNDGEKKFYINFSESLNASAAGLVKVFNSNNVDVTGSLVSLDADQNTIIVDSTTLTANESYKVVMLGAQDLSDNYFANNRVEASFKVAATETVAPTVTNLVSKDLKTVRATFSEELFVGALNKIGTVLLEGTTVADVTKSTTLTNVGDAIDVNGDGKTWDILVSATNVTGVKKVTLDAAKDLQGNAIAAPFAKFVTFTADTTAPALVSTSTAGTKLYLTFDEATTLTSGNVTVLTPDNVLKTVAVTSGTTLKHDGTNTKVVVIDLGAAAVSKNGSYKVTLASGIVADSGAITKAYESTNSYNLNADASKPTLLMNLAGTAVDANAVAQTTGDPSVITITFSEEMNSTALNVNNYTLNGVNAFSSAVFIGDTTTVKFTVKPSVIDVTGSYIVGINNVQDAAGNVISPVSYLEDAPLKENVAPTVTSAKLTAANTIRVNLSEVAASYTADPFEVYVDGVKVGTSTINAVVSGGSNNYVDVTLTTPLADLTKPIAVKVKSAASLKDANGNSLLTGGTYTVTQ